MVMYQQRQAINSFVSQIVEDALPDISLSHHDSLHDMWVISDTTVLFLDFYTINV